LPKIRHQDQDNGGSALCIKLIWALASTET